MVIIEHSRPNSTDYNGKNVLPLLFESAVQLEFNLHVSHIRYAPLGI